MKIKILFIFFIITTFPLFAQEPDNKIISKAKEFFKIYQNLENTFDKEYINLFSDDAIIIINSDNILQEKRKLELTGKDYKELLLSTLDYAKKSRDTSEYSKIKYTLLPKNRVKIEGNRYSLLKKYTSPIILILGLDDKNNLIIVFKETHSK